MTMTKKNRRWLILVAVMLGLLAGCKEQHDPGAITLMEPVALDKYVVFIDKGSDTAYLLDVLSQQLQASAKRVELGPTPVLAQRRKSSSVEELLVLCQGKEEAIGQAPKAAELLVLDGSGKTRTYPLKSRFNALVQSDDGAMAVLYFDQSKKEVGSTESDLTRRNQVAIVDLTKEPAAELNPAVRQIDSDDGSAPAAVVISPLITVVDKPRRLAVVMFKKQVSLLDLTNLEPERKEIKVPFDYLIATSPVLFGTDKAATTTLYLRSAQSDDIYIMYLLAATGKSNDFWPKIEMRKAGSLSSDMALYQQESTAGDPTTASARLLVVSQSSQKVSIIDPATGDASVIALGFGADRVLIYQAKAPFDQTVAPRALLYNSAGTSNKLAFLNLVGVEERGVQNLELKDLAKPFQSLLTLSSQEPLVALVEQGSGISLLSLTERTIDPIETGTLSAVVPDAQAKTIWLPYASTTDPKRVQLGYIQTDTRDTGYLLLDAKIDKVVPVTSGGKERVVVTHPSQAGYVTVFDAAKPKRDTAVSLQGFLLTDVLD